MERDVLASSVDTSAEAPTMTSNPHAKAARAYLEEICARIARGERFSRPRRAWWRSPAALPVAAVGIGFSVSACGGSAVTSEQGPAAGPGPEVCGDGVDNDRDGKTDCEDSDCPPCASPVYAAPWDGSLPDSGSPDSAAPDAPSPDAPSPDAAVPDSSTPDAASPDTSPPDAAVMDAAKPDAAVVEKNCCDDNDNDLDGKKDCQDPDCIGYYVGCYNTMYAAPMPELACDNQIDDDHDGKTDFDDPDCVAPNCPGYVYAAPFESNCGNGLDDDHDGKTDCQDSDCASNPACDG
jgi:hypothetical protein